MTMSKRNEWLDISDEEVESDQSTDEREESRLQGLNSRKRRKVEIESESEHESDGEEDDDAEASEGSVAESQDSEERLEETGEEKSSKGTKKHNKLKPLTPEELVAAQKAAKKTGVVYLSKVPPFMKPQKVTQLLSRFGKVGRIFLAPEDNATHARRVRAGGNRKRNFTEGWVEFHDKNAARLAAETLNANPVGGKKGGFYRDDIWNIRYLKGFKWSHLTEQIANENAARQARLRAEISRTRREDREFVRNVERARKLEGIKATREKRGEQVEHRDKDIKSFKQSAVHIRENGQEPSGEAKKVLGKIF